MFLKACSNIWSPAARIFSEKAAPDKAPVTFEGCSAAWLLGPSSGCCRVESPPCVRHEYGEGTHEHVPGYLSDLLTIMYSDMYSDEGIRLGPIAYAWESSVVSMCAASSD